MSISTHWGLRLILGIISLNAFTPLMNAQSDEQEAPTLVWRRSYKQASEEARRTNKHILVKVSATWCSPCREMHKTTFVNERLRRRLARDFVLLELDADEDTDLISDFRVEGYPTNLVITPDLKIAKRLVGFKTADQFMTSLELIKPIEDNVGNDAPSDKTFAYGGTCLVSLLDDVKQRKGSTNFKAEYKGQIFTFHSEEYRQRFIANAKRYMPVADGDCVVHRREGFGTIPGNAKYATVWKNRLWFFKDQDSQQHFIESPHYYTDGFSY